MGCDIHMILEFKHTTAKAWNNFGGNISPGRDYDMFELLAGVRGGIPKYEPRGLPDDINWMTREEFSLYVDDEATEDTEDGVTRARADSWVEQGYSRYMDDRRVHVTNPDWHTPSWLTLDELHEVLVCRKHLAADWEPGVAYGMCLAAMRYLQDNDHDSRLVFWFDN
jgi:hypothetical protein